MHYTTLYALCVGIEIYILKCTETRKRKTMTVGRGREIGL